MKTLAQLEAELIRIDAADDPKLSAALRNLIRDTRNNFQLNLSDDSVGQIARALFVYRVAVLRLTKQRPNRKAAEAALKQISDTASSLLGQLNTLDETFEPHLWFWHLKHLLPSDIFNNYSLTPSNSIHVLKGELEALITACREDLTLPDQPAVGDRGPIPTAPLDWEITHRLADLIKPPHTPPRDMDPGAGRVRARTPKTR